LLVNRERVWANAIHHVLTKGLSPEQEVDDAIARFLNEELRHTNGVDLGRARESAGWHTQVSSWLWAAC